MKPYHIEVVLVGSTNPKVIDFKSDNSELKIELVQNLIDELNQKGLIVLLHEHFHILKIGVGTDIIEGQPTIEIDVMSNDGEQYDFVNEYSIPMTI